MMNNKNNNDDDERNGKLLYFDSKIVCMANNVKREE